MEREIANLRAELEREREARVQAQARDVQALADLRRKHADELLHHAKELSGHFEVLAQRDTELDQVRWEARLAEDKWERQQISLVESGRDRLRASEADLERLSGEIGDLRAALVEAEGRARQGPSPAELERMRSVLEQAELAAQDTEAALQAAEVGHEQERRRLAECLALSEDAVDAIRETSSVELRDLERRYVHALSQKDAALAEQQRRAWEAEQALHTAEQALERAHDERLRQQAPAPPEPLKNDGLEQERAKLQAEVDRLQGRLREETDETEQHKSEADGYRHMLVKITSDLNHANDDIVRERERAGRAVADCDRASAEMRQSQAELLRRMGETQAEELNQRDLQMNRAWQETQMARREVEVARADAQQALNDLQQAHAAELNRLRRDIAEAAARRDAEVERVQQQAQLARDEAHYQRAEADEHWRQRLADAEGALAMAREELQHERDELSRANGDYSHEITRIKKAHAEDLARIGTDRGQALQQRDAELQRLRKEMQQERREAERRREEMEASWQHRLAEAEQALKTGHAEWQQERERLFRTQQELESTLAQLRATHSDEVARARGRYAEELAQRDAELERVKQDLRHEREEGERMCSSVDEAWRRRVADSEKDFANMQTDLKREREHVSRLQAEHGAKNTELRDTFVAEMTRLKQEHTRAVDDKAAEWDVERRSLQREKDRLDRTIAEIEEGWQHKMAQIEADLLVARNVQSQEREKAAKVQSECKQSMSKLELAHAEELQKSAVETERQIRRREQELLLARDEAKSMKQEASKQEQESQEAWRWLSRVEGDLKSAQQDLKKEHELVAALQAAADSSTGDLKKSHQDELRHLTEENAKSLHYREGELTAARWELQEARQTSARKFAEVEDNWRRRLNLAETEANVAKQSLHSEITAQSEQSAASERLFVEAEQARRSAVELEEHLARQASDAHGATQELLRRVAEAEARGAAGLDLATRARVDAARADQALRLCRTELEDAWLDVESLEERARSSAEALTQACAVAAHAEMAAEGRGDELRHRSEQAWRSVAQRLENEVAELRVELDEAQVPRRLRLSPGSWASPTSPSFRSAAI